MAHAYNQTQYRSPGVWKSGSNGQVPSGNPIIGGKDINGETLYIGRAVHMGDTIPGKVVPSHGVCYVSYNGSEHKYRNYQVLTNPSNANLVWLQGANGNVPSGAVQGGQQSDGQKLYIGRANFSGSLVVGKVHPNNQSLYVPFDGKEIPFKRYDVLCCRDVSQ